MADCIFCMIAEGKIPSAKVYETETVLAFRDINPQAPVHILVIPKQHIASAIEIDEDNCAVVGHIYAVIAKVAKELGFDSYRVVSNCGEQAGQTVFHVHMHLIPRYHGDVPNPKGGVRGVIPDRQKY